MQSLDPLQLDLRSGEERQVATTGHEVVHDTGYEYLAAKGVARDPRGVVHGGAEELVGFAKRVTGVDAYPYAQRRRPIGGPAG